MGVAVDLQGVSRHFVKGGQRIDVLVDLDLQLAAGDCLAVVGQSGSGKSTFLHLLGGLEPPSSGEINVDGRSLYRRSTVEIDRFRNQAVGFVFQFHHLLPDHDALDNAAIPALIARVPKAEARERARAALAKVGLSHRLGHKPGELSGGEQQRVAIARALLMGPGLLLADEPTGNLDPHTANDVMALLLDLNREGGATLVVVTHSLALAQRFPRTLRVVDGRFDVAA
ncbi:MAG: ABC transporter ATP-binding protein [Myxococcales bacterium]|nr:ABC transporter ATP-binding protein [Myxococcales bacterium]